MCSLSRLPDCGPVIRRSREIRMCWLSSTTGRSGPVVQRSREIFAEIDILGDYISDVSRENLTRSPNYE